MNILVTGGAGYIGSHLVEELCDTGESVVVFDNLYTGHREAVDPRAEFVLGDLQDAAVLQRLFAEHAFDGVMHFASYTLVGESMQQPFLYLGDNVTNALNLFHAMIDHGVKKFILSSTANLFDAPERMPIDEQERIVPGSPYGESKFIIERLLHWLDRIHGLRYPALRYFNAAGASPTGKRGEDHPVETHLIPLVLQAALGLREKIMIFGDDYSTPDGTCIRDYIHIIDSFASLGDYVFGGTHGGVVISADLGATWRNVPGPLPNPFVTALVTTTEQLFAGTLGGVFVSSDNGDSWSQASEGMTSRDVLSLVVHVDGLFAGTLSGGVFHSTDDGCSWVSAGLRDKAVNALISSGTVVYAGTDDGAFYSSNGVVSWSRLVAVGTQVGVTALALSDNNLYVGTLGHGLMFLENNSDGWVATSKSST